MPSPHIADAPTIAALEMLRLVEHIERGQGRPTCPRCGIERPSHTDICELGALLSNAQHARFMVATNGATVLELLTVKAQERLKEQQG